jgi:hypothetical protein
MKKVVDYLEKTKQSILSTELMIELLEKRIKLASENVLIETEYNANELRILILKTESEIITLKKVLNEKKKYFDRYSNQLKSDYEVVEEKYDSLMKKAELMKERNDAIKSFLLAIDKNAIEENPQAKVYAYKKLKELVKIAN